MAHIIINPSLSAAIGYKIFFNPPNVAVVIAILETANSTGIDNSEYSLKKDTVGDSYIQQHVGFDCGFTRYSIHCSLPALVGS